MKHEENIELEKTSHDETTLNEDVGPELHDVLEQWVNAMKPSSGFRSRVMQTASQTPLFPDEAINRQENEQGNEAFSRLRDLEQLSSCIYNWEHELPIINIIFRGALAIPPRVWSPSGDFVGYTAFDESIIIESILSQESTVIDCLSAH